MSEARERVNCAANDICDAWRYLGDVSYAILPHDLAHGLGDFKKSFLNFMRTAIDKEVEWIDERVAGGDRLREEWRQKCQQDEAPPATEPVN